MCVGFHKAQARKYHFCFQCTQIKFNKISVIMQHISWGFISIIKFGIQGSLLSFNFINSY